jgi:hypothetical protein
MRQIAEAYSASEADWHRCLGAPVQAADDRNLRFGRQQCRNPSSEIRHGMLAYTVDEEDTYTHKITFGTLS